MEYLVGRKVCTERANKSPHAHRCCHFIEKYSLYLLCQARVAVIAQTRSGNDPEISKTSCKTKAELQNPAIAGFSVKNIPLNISRIRYWYGVCDGKADWQTTSQGE